MSQKEVSCPACGCDAACYPDHEQLTAFYECPVCGRFELKYPTENSGFNRNHLAAYLIYHKFDSKELGEYRYHTVQSKEFCDKYRHEFDQGHNICGRPVHMDAEMIENWYPKTFAERIDYVLMYLGSNIKHIGQKKTFSYQEVVSALLVDRYELDGNNFSPTYNQWLLREENECDDELEYIIKYLNEKEFISGILTNCTEEYADIVILPAGYSRIDELQKITSHGRSVLVAMKFGDDTKLLREAIRQGIQDAGYVAIFIDEVQHNDFITPELLKHIKDSKFVVVDLTHQNNGAYFEEGYAMGLGKPVIQLCRHSTQLHFDIAQKNTIIWNTEDEIPERLCNRIKATID